jgi:hypothetical protein
MDSTQKRTLPVVLIAAVVHGFALYALHLSIEHEFWPAPHRGWLLGLYAVAVFIPLTVQMLAEHARERALPPIVALLAVAYFYFGWHHGSSIVETPSSRMADSGQIFPLPFVLLVLWLMVMPFLQWRLSSGHWRAPYAALFATAWRNKVTLAEAAAFTALLWALLLLWQALFDLIGIGFFEALFQKPLFVYPVTAITFGVALHLIGSVDRLTSVVLEQILNVLKWLAVIAGLILAMFTITLIFKLPSSFASQQRAIGAAWLLWLVAVMVLLLNAAYRDGSVATPYPRWIALALRVVTPLTVIVSLTALYALYVRIDAYGATVGRVWAVIVASSALAYSAGYSWSAWRGGASAGPWMSGMARVNVVVAVALIATLALALTPLLSPYRIAANSQYRIALSKPPETAAPEPYNASASDSAFTYLRFSAGDYGIDRLEALAEIENHADAAAIRTAAQDALNRKNRWEAVAPADATEFVAKLKVYPEGRQVDEALRARLQADLATAALQYIQTNHAVGMYVDLNDDDIDEFVLVTRQMAPVYELTTEQQWRPVGSMHAVGAGAGDLEQEIQKGNVETEPREWRDLVIGELRLRLSDFNVPGR